MRNTGPPELDGFQYGESCPSIRQILGCLYSRVTAPDYTHDTNPWSDSDPGLRSISTASLELLQDHAEFHMQAFLYVHELLDRELVDRKLVSRTRLTGATSLRALPEGSSVSEVLFDIEDLEPLSSFLRPQDSGNNVRGFMPGDRIEAMAKLAYAWVDGDRSTSAQRRRAESRQTCVQSQAPPNAAVEGRAEAGEAGETDKENKLIADMLELEAEMGGFGQVEDDESISEIESITSSLDSSSPLLGREPLGGSEKGDVSVERSRDAGGPGASVNTTDQGAGNWWLRLFTQ